MLFISFHVNPTCVVIFELNLSCIFSFILQPLEEVFAENISIAVKNSMSGWGKEDSFSQKLQDEEYCLRTVGLCCDHVIFSVTF